jgi:Glycosyltransferase family 87
VWSWLRNATAVANRAGGGLWLDLILYLVSALFAQVTTSSTLLPHRAWGAVAVVGYTVGAVLVAIQLLARTAGPVRWRGVWGAGSRTALTAWVWAATALLPLVIEAVQRAGGRIDRAQEEVLVTEEAGRRLLETGSPYLDRATIAGLPPGDRLQAYLPYQPGMAAFGVPRALDPTSAWWSDARVWFALVTGACLAVALVALRRAGAPAPALVRALQAATVLPICALTLATGGDDLPVLALCLLALALAATRRFGWAGVAVGAAAALKLFAWPVAVAVGLYAATRGRPTGWRFLAGAVGVPLVTALPVLSIGPGAMIENVVAFPFGRGLVTSPAASPLPGHLIATSAPGGSSIATVVLLIAGVTAAVAAIRSPPRTAAAASRLAGLWLLVAFLLLPATRFGYLLYPAALLVWTAALRTPPPNDTPTTPTDARLHTAS